MTDSTSNAAFTVKNIRLEVLTLQQPAVWGRTLNGDAIFTGGFSGLLFLGSTTEGELQFMSHTDRGPNSEPVSIDGLGKNLRPFLLPEFQPRWIKLETNRKNNTFHVVEEILLTDLLGDPLSGRPNRPKPFVGKAESPPHTFDEVGINIRGELISADLNGIDPEGLAIDDQGHIWMAEEYQPSLLKFDRQGRLLKRICPKNSFSKQALETLQKKYGSGYVVEGLPEELNDRKVNRGFEGLTFANGKLYVFLQSSLQPDKALHTQVIRLLQFDPETLSTTGQYLYPIENEKADKIGDLAYHTGTDSFLTIQQNSKTGAEGIHDITQFKLDEKFEGTSAEKMSFDSLQKSDHLIKVRHLISLSKIGFDFAEKIEGLAAINDQLIAVINDNDFGVSGLYDIFSKKVPLDSEKKSYLALIHFGSATK